MVDGRELRKRIEARIAQLPPGYISKKNIKGKTQRYLQWRENGKLKSRYIRAGELEKISGQIEERRALQKELRELRLRYPEEGETVSYETNVVCGDALRHMTEAVRGLRRRDCYESLADFLRGADRTRVCALYGLRRTGKTTLILQALLEMPPDRFERSAYLKIRTSDTMDRVTRDLRKLFDAGFRYVFMDEATLMSDFVDSAALLSDVYAMMGMKIVLSGTDSLGFWFARDNELYDRVRLIHTTFIPFREYGRLLGMDSVDEYMRYGGTLRRGDPDLDDPDALAEDAAFRDDESTRRYIDTAICRNIQHSLACFEGGKYFGKLYDLYSAGELTNAINRIIEDMNHRFLAQVLTREFVSSDLGISSRNLRGDRDPDKRSDVPDNGKAVTERMMRLLDIRDKDRQTVGILPEHLSQIRLYLKALDLIVECPVVNGEPGVGPDERVLFAQPGMRHCQAEALVHALTRDPVFARLSDPERDYVSGRVSGEIRGRMLEDMILLECMKALGKDYDVFKYRFASGEFDMVIYGKKERACAVYEIKHSGQRAPEQARHLRDERMLSLTSPRFGTLAGRYVLYMGEDFDTEDGVRYRNAAEFLRRLPEIRLDDFRPGT